MKVAGIVLGILVLAGCAAGLITMSQSLGATQDELDQTKASLTRTQLEQQNIADSLEETSNELQDTITSLEEQKRETDKYRQLYQSTQDELENTENDVTYLENKLAMEEQESQELQKLINELQEKLALYEDTLGTHVYSGTIPPYHSGNVPQIILKNKASARDPTWEELLDFLEEDKTDMKLYVEGEYECGNFAQKLHDNAESKGIRAAFVVVHFHDDLSHALNAFKTIDRGLVYIDDTGDKYQRSVANLDKLVEMAKDEYYNASFLFPEYLVLAPDDRKVQSIEIYW